MFYYFAYGSNMDAQDLRLWCKSNTIPYTPLKLVSLGILHSYQLVFNYYSRTRKGGVANIMPHSDHSVYGIVFEITDEIRDTILRPKEGYPFLYSELIVDIQTSEKAITALTYKINKDKELFHHIPPSTYYLNLIITAAKHFNFEEKYMQYLDNIQSV